MQARFNRYAVVLAVAATGALAAPSFAAAPADSEPRLAVFPLPAKAAAKTLATARDARREQRERRQEALGPVNPLLGTPDYGTSDNGFGAPRSGHMHSGQDVFAPPGTPLVAVTEATVAEAGTDGAQGNYVYLYDEGEDRTFVYMHMIAPPKVKAGDSVEAGDPLGGVGCTGSCWGDHLHFEVRSGKGYAGEAQDPLPMLKSWPRVSG